ncbi:MAG TPA: hypothetical protein VE621_03230, partial [Bryobacteraceae bacterium]|nr:hypothetical protein [Bryobacteraceae bacterium]
MRFALIALLLCGAVYLSSQQAPRPEPGPLQGGGGFLLNSGWRVTPVGRQVKLGTLPMSSALSPDGKYLLILNGGYMPPNVAVLDAASMQEVSTTGPLADAWLGLTFSPDGKFVYVGGGATSTVYEFSFAAGQMKETRRFEIT